MARFRGFVQGNRGEATRLGHSVLTTYNDGWYQGVSVIASRNDDDEDMHSIMLNGGNTGKSGTFSLGHYTNGTFYPSERLIELIKNKYL